MIAPRAALAAVLALAAAAAAAVAESSEPDPLWIVRSVAFQSDLGGLGLGALDLASCDAAYDPRVGFPCPDATGAIPGGRRFCPHLGGPEVRPR